MSNNTKPLYYWHDGYFIEDREEAELMDSINAFGGTHGETHVPEDWNRELIHPANTGHSKKRVSGKNHLQIA